jgi:imidazolonepropionase-like amidohydrolase
MAPRPADRVFRNGRVYIVDELDGIEVGKLADVIVLDKDLFEIPAADIATAKVQLTLLEGVSVFSSLADG